MAGLSNVPEGSSANVATNSLEFLTCKTGLRLRKYTSTPLGSNVLARSTTIDTVLCNLLPIGNKQNIPIKSSRSLSYIEFHIFHEYFEDHLQRQLLHNNFCLRNKQEERQPNGILIEPESSHMKTISYPSNPVNSLRANV